MRSSRQRLPRWGFSALLLAGLLLLAPVRVSCGCSGSGYECWCDSGGHLHCVFWNDACEPTGWIFTENPHPSC